MRQCSTTRAEVQARSGAVKGWVYEPLPGTPQNSALGKALVYGTTAAEADQASAARRNPSRQQPHRAENQTLRNRQTILVVQPRRGRRAGEFESVLAGDDGSREWRGAVRVLELSVCISPAASTVEQIEALLPCKVTPAQLTEHEKKQDQLQ
jgi:hypothetical protein